MTSTHSAAAAALPEFHRRRFLRQLTDKDLTFGELSVITLSEGTPRMSLAIVQLLREEPCGLNDELLGLWCAFHAKENPGLKYQGMHLRYVDGLLNAGETARTPSHRNPRVAEA